MVLTKAGGKQPANSLAVVRELAADEIHCEFYSPVVQELGRHKLDTDDLREIIMCDLGETHCIGSKPTQK